jgi:hypothetical protein
LEIGNVNIDVILNFLFLLNGRRYLGQEFLHIFDRLVIVVIGGLLIIDFGLE